MAKGHWIGGRVLSDKVKFKDAVVGEKYILQCVASNGSMYGGIGIWKKIELLEKKRGRFIFSKTDDIKFRDLDDGSIDEVTLRPIGDFVLLKYSDHPNVI